MCGGAVNTRSHALAVWINGGVPQFPFPLCSPSIMYPALNLMMITLGIVEVVVGYRIT